MYRIFSLLALLAGAAIIVIGLVEIHRREPSNGLALPTPIAASAEPSTTEPPSTPPPTEAPTPVPSATTAPSSVGGTQALPHSGANPVPAGIAIVALAGAASAVERRSRRSY